MRALLSLEQDQSPSPERDDAMMELAQSIHEGLTEILRPVPFLDPLDRCNWREVN